MREKRHIPACLALLLASIALTACASTGDRRSDDDPIEPSRRPQRDAAIRRPLVLPSYALRQAASANPPTDAYPWYLARKDAQRTVEAGYRSAIFENVYRVTSDHQSHHGDHIHDYYHNRTYRSRHFQTVR